MHRFIFRKTLLAFMAGVLITLFATGASTVFAKAKFSQNCPTKTFRWACRLSAIPMMT